MLTEIAASVWVVSPLNYAVRLNGRLILFFYVVGAGFGMRAGKFFDDGRVVFGSWSLEERGIGEKRRRGTSPFGTSLVNWKQILHCP